MTVKVGTKSIETPELDRQSEVIGSGMAAAVQDFYDWLTEQDYRIAKYRYEETVRCPGRRRDPFDSSNCEDGKVKKTVTLWRGSERIGRVVEGEVCPECKGAGEVTHTLANPRLEEVITSPQQLMADHFGIDLDKIEAERRALLEMLRDSHV